MRLTKTTVEGAPCPEPGQEPRFLRDDETRGLALRITANGARSFVLECRVKGRPRRMTLGPWPTLSVLDARVKATKLRAAILDGEDPSAETAAVHHEPKFGELAAIYMERHATPRKKSAWQDENTLRRYIPKSWNSRRLSDITRADVARLHANVGEVNGPYAANRMLALLRTMFAKAHEPWQLTRTTDNPATKIEMFPEEKRERYLSPEELQRVNAALLAEKDWRWRAFFPLSLLLGVRRGELLSARWADFDFAARTWRISETKSGKPLLLPVPTPAVAILEGLPSFGKNEFVFPGRGKTGHIVEPKVAWARIRTAAGVADVTIHDLRHTLGGRLASAGVSLPLIGRALNHSQPATTARYAHVALDPVRRVLEANALAMIADTRGTKPEA